MAARPPRLLRSLCAHLSTAAAAAASAEEAEAEEPAYTLQQVREHQSAESCWVAICDGVYDFTAFVDRHPGGARALLRHAGTDASDVFTELHSQSIFGEFAPQYRIGRLASPGDPKAATVGPSWGGVQPSTRFWEGLRPDQPLDGAQPVLSSPFPHQRFDSSGLETFRFNWAQADRLLRLETEPATHAQSAAAQDRRTTSHMLRQKSSLGVLNLERDWLHVNNPRQYASEMLMKETLLLEHAELTYVSAAQSLAAEQEVLDLLLPWLLRNYPDQFKLSDDRTVFETTSTGYQRRFVLADWASAPLKLVGLLVQEDFYLLEEQELSARATTAPLPPLPKGQNMIPNFVYDAQDHIEEHPSEKQHVFLSACSCFSFEAVPRFGKTMASIHHPNVPGWFYSLQRGMNRLFANMAPEVAWYRHNWGFHLTNSWTGPMGHGFEWAHHVVPGLVSSAASKTTEEEDEQGEVGGVSKKPPELGMWEQILAGGDDFIRSSVSHHIEFQTLRRLPKTNYILFTVKRYQDPMSALDRYPGAAAALAASVRRKNKASLLRNGLGVETHGKAMLGYLDRIAAKGGLRSGPLPGLAEPWERQTKSDGTIFAEKGARAIGREPGTGV